MSRVSLPFATDDISDSISFDLGGPFPAAAAQEKFGAPVPRVRARLRRLVCGIGGGQSGGALATGIATMAAAQASSQIMSVLVDPFALTSGFKGHQQPDGSGAYDDTVTGSWVASFRMAAIDTKVAH
jgi:hypothetical protein